jgi:hypothetical protein
MYRPETGLILLSSAIDAEQLERISNAFKVAIKDPKLSQLLATAWYYSCSTVGEQATDLMIHSKLKWPLFLARIMLKTIQSWELFKRFALIDRLHKLMFYFTGDYFDLANRITSARYVACFYIDSNARFG